LRSAAPCFEFVGAAALFNSKTRSAYFGQSHKIGLTERQQMDIDAIGKEHGYRDIQAKYPDDLEARAFEVWRVWHKYEQGKALQPEVDRVLGLLRICSALPANHRG
jgi:hypothetical protein